MGPRDRCFSASPMAWKWILEKLVDNKNVGKPILKGLSGYVKDIEEPQCRPLLRRLALRYLEESLANDRLDISIIPLVQAASEIDTPDSRLLASQKTRDRKLLLRVKTEAAISCIRKEAEGEVADWDAFAETLDEVFAREDLDPEAVIQRKELLAVLAAKDEKVVGKYSVQRLRNDLLHFIKQKKALMDHPVLDQIAHGYFDGSLQNKSYISADGQKNSDVGDVHVKHRTRCQAPLSDIVNHAKEIFGMRRKEGVPSPTAEGQPIGIYDMSNLSQNGMCVESKEDSEELLDKARQPASQVTHGLIGARNVQSSQANEGNFVVGRLSVQSDATTEIADGRKRQREYVETDDVTVVQRKDIPQVDTDSNGRKHASSSGNPLKLRRTTVNCFECSMGGSLLCCDTCQSSYHLECLGSQSPCKWTCPDCGNLCIVPASKLLPTPPPLGMPDTEELYSSHVAQKGTAHVGSDDPVEALGTNRTPIFLKSYSEREGAMGETATVEKIAAMEKTAAVETTATVTQKGTAYVDSDDPVEALGTNQTLKFSKSYSERDGALVETAISVDEEDEEAVEMRKLLEMQRQHFRQKVCCICGDGGNLLFCGDCPIGMHRKCLAPGESRVDGELCPYCMRKKALQAVLNAKEAARLAQRQFEEAKKILAQLHDRLPQKQEGVDRENFSHTSRQQQTGFSSANGNHSTRPSAGVLVNSTIEQQGHQHSNVSIEACGKNTGGGDEEPRGTTEPNNDHHGQNGTASDPQTTVPKSESPRGEVEGERHDGDLEQTSRPPKSKKKLSSGRKAIPGLRRKALAWTPQEEEALKEGVMRYSHDGGRWGFQWQRILESGFGVFDPSRTGVDLKDKWRNMQRRVSPSKPYAISSVGL